MNSIAEPIHTSPAPPIAVPTEIVEPNAAELSADREVLTLECWQLYRVRQILEDSNRYDGLCYQLRIAGTLNSTIPVTLYLTPEEHRVITAALAADKDPVGTILAEQDRAEKARITAKVLEEAFHQALDAHTLLEKAFHQALDTSRALATALEQVRFLAGAGEVFPVQAPDTFREIRQQFYAALEGMAK